MMARGGRRSGAGTVSGLGDDLAQHVAQAVEDRAREEVPLRREEVDPAAVGLDLGRDEAQPGQRIDAPFGSVDDSRDEAAGGHSMAPGSSCKSHSGKNDFSDTQPAAK